MILGALGLIGGLVSTGFSIFGQNQQAEAAEQAAKYNNALAEQEARNRENETREGIKRERVRNREVISSIRSRMAASGVQTSTGTPAEILAASAGRMELAIADAARASSMEASSLRAKGRMGLWEAEQTSDAARLSMIATGITGAGKFYTQFHEGRYQGTY